MKRIMMAAFLLLIAGWSVAASNDEDGVMRILRGIGPDGKWEEIG